MSRGPAIKGTDINMASGALFTALRGHLYNIKHIARTCIVFGGLLVPDYPDFFWFTWGTGTFTILSALGIAILRKSLQDKVRAHLPLFLNPQTKAATEHNQDLGPEEETGSDDDDDSTSPDYSDEDGYCEPAEVDFDSLDPDAKKAFILAVSLLLLSHTRRSLTNRTIQHWGDIFPPSPETAEFFNIAPLDSANTQRVSTPFLPSGSVHD